jgi:hypothetical protein
MTVLWLLLSTVNTAQLSMVRNLTPCNPTSLPDFVLLARKGMLASFVQGSLSKESLSKDLVDESIAFAVAQSVLVRLVRVELAHEPRMYLRVHTLSDTHDQCLGRKHMCYAARRHEGQNTARSSISLYKSVFPR